MPRIAFVRDHPADIRHRYAIICIDGKFVGKMAFGDTIDAEVLPGNHEIVGKNELGKTTLLALNVPEQDDVKVRVGAVPKGCFAILMWVFPPAPTIILEVIAE